MLQITLLFISKFNQIESAIYSLSLIYVLVSVIYSLLSEDLFFSEFLFFSHKSIKLTICPLRVLQQIKQNDS